MNSEYTKSWQRQLVILIFAGALLLRLLLGIYNREANDNHVDVVSLIVDKHTLPEKDDCWSCYQPKLYYLVCAGVVKLFHVQDFYGRVVVMQLVNVFTSFFILLLFWKFIDKQDLTVRRKLLTFAFFAFNPCLTGINVQGTNDTPVIFFGVLAVYAADAFFRKMKLSPGIALIIALVAGALTKASAFVLTGAISVIFILKLLAERSRTLKWRAAIYLSILLLTFVVIVPFAGGYYNNDKKYNSLTLSTWNRNSRPYFFKTTPVERPGLQNMYEGFFTFRYLDMIRQPYINNEVDNYPAHRTSLWSQMYGRTLFMHFDQWPPGWQSHDPFILLIGKILIVLGIVPLLLFLAGLVNSLDFVRNFLKMNRAYLAAPENYLHLVITLAVLASSIFYTYNYRDFSSMKSFYIFPGSLSIIKLFCDGLSLIKNRISISIVELVLMLMILLSIADTVFLIQQLH
jgi:hypothetical protein